MNKPIQPIEDRAFLSGYLTELLTKYPSAKPEKELLLDFLVAGSNANFMSQHGIAKNTVTSRWKEATENLPIDQNSPRPRKSYRETLLDLVGVSGRQLIKDYDRYIENSSVEYVHEAAPKPSKQEVLRVVAAQDKTLSMQVLELMPLLTDKEWNLIDAYRATL